jgi:hypothetical protein
MHPKPVPSSCLGENIRTSDLQWLLQVPAVSLLITLETARQGRSVLLSDEQRLLFEGRKRGFA